VRRAGFSMMECEIIVSPDIPSRFEKWTREILELFGPNITYSAGRKYSLRMPVSRIYLQGEREYEKSLSSEESDLKRLNTGYSPRLESYANLKSDQPSVDIRRFYGEERVVPIDSSLGYWTPIAVYDQLGIRVNRRFESVIFLCPSRIQKYAPKLRRRLPEIDPRLLQKYVFKIALIHEIGHHYSLANFPTTDVQLVMAFQDLNILEGLANWFAYMFLTKEERWVQAEMAVNQDITYRHYLYFKHSDLSVLLDCFLAEMNYSKAPVALKKIIGGQHNLNGFMMSVGGKYDAIAMDWSGRGGIIVAGDSIKGLATMNRGCFIAPKIEFLIGRFPKETLVIANEITNIFDYGKIPENVIILPKDEKDLNVIINSHKQDDAMIALRLILQDIGIDSATTKSLLEIPYPES
jgi:hypothetical protein